MKQKRPQSWPQAGDPTTRLATLKGACPSNAKQAYNEPHVDYTCSDGTFRAVAAHICRFADSRNDADY
jgi:hypothetical protein